MATRAQKSQRLVGLGLYAYLALTLFFPVAIVLLWAFYDPAASLGGRCFPSPGALLDGLLMDVERHTDGRTFDDMALLAVARG